MAPCGPGPAAGKPLAKEAMAMDAVQALAVGYALGSIPFGLLLTRLTGAGDLRAIGSGNIGATNVLRTGNKGLAVATLLLDGVKGLVAVLIAWRFWPEFAGLAGLGAIVGHCFPVWLRFRGGKGVATAGGVCFGLAWPLGAIYAAVWAVMLAAARVSSLAGMTAVLAAPLAALALGYTALIPVLAGIALIVIVQHRANLARLRAGTEPRIGATKR
jgi:glycerol-3-phosphate acyltransferase PlsY